MSRWWTLVVVCVATFMLFDVTIVNVALPDIQRELGSSFSDVQWVIDAYSLLLASLLLTAGSVADRIGRRLIFVIGLVVFTIASALCGLSGSPLALNLARGLQGVGGAMLFATSLALLAGAYQGPSRGTAFGIWGATTGGAVAVGPLLGGVLTDGIGWEAIFFVNVPVGIAALVVTLRTVQESYGERGKRIDLAGTVTFTAALACLVFALIRGNTEGWTSGIIVALLVVAVLGIVAFVAVEARSDHPMLDLALFRKPTFVGASAAAFALSASLFAMFLYITFYLQNVLGNDPLDAGFKTLALSVLSFLVAPVAGKLAGRLPIRLFLGGGLLLVALSLLLIELLTEVGSSWTVLLPGFVLGGIGIGLVNPPLATAAVGVVEPRRSGMASGINSTFRQVGIATGIAGLGALFASRVDGQEQVFARAVGRGVPAGAGEFSDFVSFGLYNRLGPEAQRAGEAAFLHGFHTILLVAAAVALLGAVLAFVLVRPADFVAHGEGAPQDAPAAG